MAEKSVRDMVYEYLTKGARARRIPLELARVIEAPPVPIALSKALFGLPVLVPGETPIYKGLYVTHREYIAPEGRENWVIRTGIFSILAVFEERGKPHYYPFAENGLLTALAPSILEWIERGYDDYGRRFAGYFEASGDFNYAIVETPKDDILFMDKITRGELPLIIVDKYRVLRSSPPSEFIDEFASLQYLVRELTKQKAEYERTIRRLRLTVATREAEYTALKRDVEELRNSLITLLRENERMRGELMDRDLRERFRIARLDMYDRIVEAFERNLAEIQGLISRVVSIEQAIAEKVPLPPPVPAKPPEAERPPEKKPPEKAPAPRYIRVREGE